ncbi:polysaccharide biosynthesis C-terminal domain-containing protein (plasmid) [Skermanella rosea]|uniref:lipopolysaccharide biosynthesis protein n=1 Tax=Skermanella rosea TaxID=1817965 RepID=UPI001934444C|nr:polysaccharide biosynthesis C-terminal domain-containing protein [Skermanella rosea]UEM07350.1 polysaccharide biosynthesis C-terminal domain-containing protein [Skermanella rosea]
MNPRRLLPFGSIGFWTLMDQGVVSLGTFIVNIVLARYLEPAGYGVFVLLYSSMLILQMANSALIFYPLSIRGAVAQPDEVAVLMGGACLLTALASLIYCLPLAAVPLFLDRPDLVLPAVLCFLGIQFQEALRRGLFATLRHRSAIWGDLVNYPGQAALAITLAFTGSLHIDRMLYGMAVLASLGAVVQLFQLAPARPALAGLPPLARDFIQTGHWALTANLVSVFRYQALIGLVTAAGGVAAAGMLQATANLANLANPLILGLCNIIPQMAARGQAEKGEIGGWAAVRRYIFAGAGPMILFYILLLAMPEVWLRLFYGASYTGLTVPLRILAVAMAANYMADMTCSYLVGIDKAKLSFLIGAAGAGTTMAVAIPLINSHGISGACAAMLASAIIRAALCYRVVRKLGTGGAAYA